MKQTPKRWRRSMAQQAGRSPRTCTERAIADAADPITFGHVTGWRHVNHRWPSGIPGQLWPETSSAMATKLLVERLREVANSGPPKIS
jgi:hypothetical protein